MTDFERLLLDLADLDGCPRTKRRVRELLRRYTGRELYISNLALLREERRETLRQLLSSSSYTRAEQVRILAQRWGITTRAARRWLPE